MRSDVVPVGFKKEEMEMEARPMMETLLEEEEPSVFAITDDKLAEWAVRKIVEARNDTEKWRDHFAAQLAAIEKRNQQTETYLTYKLSEYFVTVPHKETKTQAKYSLPSADLICKQQPPEIIKDDNRLLTFFDENGMGDYVKTIRKPDWAAYKKACTIQPDGTIADKETGMIVDGVMAETRPDKFEVRIND